MRPLIGLVGRRKKAGVVAGMPDSLAHVDLDLYFADYARGVLAAGGLAVHLPMDLDPAEAIECCDGVLLSGGADIDPGRYGHDPETDEFPPEPMRDELELALMDLASDRSIPVLGICRGLQLANVHGGGSLHQDVPAHARYDVAPDHRSHVVRTEPDSVLRSVYGPEHRVNSLHHQTVDQIADAYRVTARAEDGTIEGLEHRDLPIVTVQWHPEMMDSRDVDPVFAWLVDAARSFAGSRRA